MVETACAMQAQGRDDMGKLMMETNVVAGYHWMQYMGLYDYGGVCSQVEGLSVGKQLDKSYGRDDLRETGTWRDGMRDINA